MRGLLAIAMASVLVHCQSADGTGTLTGPRRSAEQEPVLDMDGSVDLAFDAHKSPPQPPNVQLPVVACGPDVTLEDAAECALPPSQCVGNWLLYFIDGVCVNGTCVWTKKMVPCPYSCSKGACVGGGSTGPTPPT